MTVAELERRMSRRELTEWTIYAQKHPFGPHRDNIHTGMIAALIANVNKRRGARPSRVADFMPFIEKAPADQLALENRLKAALLGVNKPGHKKKGKQ